MTKTLTEQWKDGTLEAGDYYCRRGKFSFIGYPADGMLAYRQHDIIEIVEEVLEPVPSYEEVQKLKEQLEEANEALKACANNWSDVYARRKADSYFERWGVKRW